MSDNVPSARTQLKRLRAERQRLRDQLAEVEATIATLNGLVAATTRRESD